MEKKEMGREEEEKLSSTQFSNTGMGSKSESRSDALRQQGVYICTNNSCPNNSRARNSSCKLED